MIEARTEYDPGGTLIIKYLPSASQVAPIIVPSIITVHPGTGSFVVASLTVPAILPVVPANINPGTIAKRATKKNTLVFIEYLPKRVIPFDRVESEKNGNRLKWKNTLPKICRLSHLKNTLAKPRSLVPLTSGISKGGIAKAQSKFR
jgi:hypothetical protein